MPDVNLYCIFVIFTLLHLMLLIQTCYFPLVTNVQNVFQSAANETLMCMSCSNCKLKCNKIFIFLFYTLM